jgi:hypothetical protein
MRTRFVSCAVAPLLIALLLGSCGPKRNEFAPACPLPGLVKPLAELVRYRGPSQDVRNLVIRARIVDIAGKCEPGDDDTTVVTTATLVVEATRGPAMQGDAVSLPAFVAISDAGTVLDKIQFDLPVEFARNVDIARATSRTVRTEIRVTPQKSGAAYGIVGGFQLTPEEVAAFRRNNPK